MGQLVQDMFGALKSELTNSSKAKQKSGLSCARINSGKAAMNITTSQALEMAMPIGLLPKARTIHQVAQGRM